MSKISVIMPCLNVANYIKKCMDSVVGQTWKDIEVLVVDAGSTDGTRQILEEYRKRDSRVHILTSDKKSYGYQMNLGIARAKGEYIGIVETDDFVGQDMFERLYTKAVATKADYVKGTSVGFYQGLNETKWTFPIIPCGKLSEASEVITVPKEMPWLFLSDNFLWNGIYRREFMQRIGFHETSGAAFQDIGALFQIISRAEKGIYLNHLVYHYRQDNLGASSYHKKSFDYTISEYHYIAQFLNGLSEEWEKIYYLKMAGLCTDRFHFMGASGEFWEESRGAITELYRNLKQAVEKGIVDERDCNLWQVSLWEELSLFLNDPITLFLYNRDNYNRKREELENIEEIARTHKVFIFGAGSLGQFLYMYLILQGIHTVAAYCDNNRALQGKKLQNLIVLTPEEAVHRAPDGYYLIAAGKNSREKMKVQLLEMGIEEKRIGFFSAGTDIRLLKK